MNGGYSLLESAVWDILCVINPTEEDRTLRCRIIQELRSIAESVESLRGASVEPYGSFCSDLFTRSGDLDISMELHCDSYIAILGREHKQNILSDLQNVLEKKAGFFRVQFISNARVPILKFETGYNISCDISINNLCGQMKSKLLFWINGIDGRFRDLVLLVKEWAKTHNINDSRSGTFNSYCLSLLVIFHLQTSVPAILPPLREIYSSNLVNDLRGVRADVEKQIEETFSVNINRIKSDTSRLFNRSTVPQLFISFLAKFADICSRASVQSANLCTGKWEDINTNMRWWPETYALFVEDPFERPSNTARTVSIDQMTKISNAIITTQRKLFSPQQNRASIICALVRPYIASQVLLLTPPPIPAIPGPPIPLMFFPTIPPFFPPINLIRDVPIITPLQKKIWSDNKKKFASAEFIPAGPPIPFLTNHY